MRNWQFIAGFVLLTILCIAGFKSYAQVSDTNPPAPQPASATPSTEVIGGNVGSSTMQYALADHTHPRITRSMVVSTAADGTFSGTWTTALSSTPVVQLTWVNSGSLRISCELSANPTTTTFQGKCWKATSTLLNLSIITTGLTLSSDTSSGAGIAVQVLAIPPTQ